jgi:hypothetical protein
MRLANADADVAGVAPAGNVDYYDGGPIETTPARTLGVYRNDHAIPEPFRAQGAESHPMVNYVQTSARPFDQDTLDRFTGQHSIIGRQANSLPVGSMDPYGPTPRVTFRAPPTPWDAGTELGT